ncbi:Terpene synthase 3 [Abeliophyllum distichum]|uniref:Terpene synthase 3 n=1 Tax=Abeliophyllum distichum TaxID=126358 RepID=A0ABD1UR10_9LAMI
MSERNLLPAYYLAAASYFEPKKSKERLAWDKTTILMEAIATHFGRNPIHKQAFVDEFLHGNSLRKKLVNVRVDGEGEDLSEYGSGGEAGTFHGIADGFLIRRRMESCADVSPASITRSP